MARNVEIKASLTEQQFDQAYRLATELTNKPAAVLRQTDTYFQTFNGRLKLRQFDDGSAELIAYQRSDQPDPALSRYIRIGTTESDHVIEAFRLTMGIRGVVTKTRHLFLVDQTRIHLDQVEQLGAFIELEVVLRPEQTQHQGIRIANDLIRDLRIREDQMISESYIDLIKSFATRSAKS